MLEVLIVILIIGLIAALVVPNILSQQQKSSVNTAKIQISKFEEILTMYYLDNQHFPSSEQGLEALVTRPTGFPEPRNWGPESYMKKVPVDPWGNEYIYVNQDGDIEIHSWGSDGKEGGTGSKEDIYLSNI